MSKPNLRVNEHNPDSVLRIKSDKVSPGYIRGGKQINPILPGQALSQQIPVWEIKGGTYRTGDGDTPQFQRQGSNHNYIKSRGYV